MNKTEAKLIYAMNLNNKKRLEFPIKGLDVNIYSRGENGDYIGGSLLIEFMNSINYLNDPKCKGIMTSNVQSVEYKGEEFRVFTLNSKYVFKIKKETKRGV